MAMVEAGSPEAIWTVQVVAPIEIHMMVTVRYDFISVVAKDDHCGTKKSCKNNQPNHSIDYCNLQSHGAAVFPQPRGNSISGSLIELFIPFTIILPWNLSFIFSCYQKYIIIGISTEEQN